MYLDPEHQRRLLPIKATITEKFDQANWLELAALTGSLNEVRGHDRLLRSLSWGDPDYPGNVMDILVSIVTRDPDNLDQIEAYLAKTFEAEGENISSVDTGRRIYFTPSVFEIPEQPLDRSLIAVMMPFEASFRPVYEAIKEAASIRSLTCQRADDIWEHSTVIQDVFALIFRSAIVVCDFSGRNPNVFYEAGIAHTLGKHVVPIAQHESDIPFDLRHHRYLSYLKNEEGLGALTKGLADRFLTLDAPEMRRLYAS